MTVLQSDLHIPRLQFWQLPEKVISRTFKRVLVADEAVISKLSSRLPSSGLMFSSLLPKSALVLGVHSGRCNFSDSFRPAGSVIPHTVPSF